MRVRLWQSLAQIIGHAVRRMSVDVTGDIAALKSDRQTADEERFWKHVEFHLAMNRRCGRWEGAETVKRIVRSRIESLQ